MLTKEMTQDLPTLPGVYLFHDKRGKVLYVGKAKSLRKRVQSYRYNTKKRHRKITRMVDRIERIDYEICASEFEALLLESRLIKEYEPPYNTRLKGERKSWFVKIDFNDDFPRLEIVFEETPDGARYFGPYSSLRWTRELVDVVHRIFPIRVCEGPLRPRVDFRPCLEYHLKRCEAPCAAKVSRQAYHAMFDDVSRLLMGEPQEVVASLIDERDKAAAGLVFERAGALQKRIEQIEKVFVFLDVHRRSSPNDEL